MTKFNFTNRRLLHFATCTGAANMLVVVALFIVLLRQDGAESNAPDAETVVAAPKSSPPAGLPPTSRDAEFAADLASIRSSLVRFQAMAKTSQDELREQLSVIKASSTQVQMRLQKIEPALESSQERLKRIESSLSAMDTKLDWLPGERSGHLPFTPLPYFDSLSDEFEGRF